MLWYTFPIGFLGNTNSSLGTKKESLVLGWALGPPDQQLRLGVWQYSLNYHLRPGPVQGFLTGQLLVCFSDVKSTSFGPHSRQVTSPWTHHSWLWVHSVMASVKFQRTHLVSSFKWTTSSGSIFDYNQTQLHDMNLETNQLLPRMRHFWAWAEWSFRCEGREHISSNSHGRYSNKKGIGKLHQLKWTQYPMSPMSTCSHVLFK